MANVGHNTNSALAPAIRRVYYSGTGTIYEGMAVCYNNDRTTDMDGTTVAAGTTNNGRWMDVEDPKAANMQFFAGVVRAGSYGSTTGPAWLDIYTPNGQSVPVRGTSSFTNGEKIYIAAGDSEITNVPQGGGFVGYAMDTIDRSSTEGLLLAKLVDSGLAPGEAVLTAGASSPSPLIWNEIDLARLRSGDLSYGFMYETDYLNTIDVTTGDGYVITAVTSGAIAPVTDEQGGVLLVDSAGNATADDGVNVQLTNCMFKPAAGVTIAFEARCKVVDAGDDQYYIGLAGIDTTLIAAGVLDDVVDKCGFYREAASTADKISSVTARTSADDKTADVADLADDTYTTLGFVIDGLTSVKFYVNGALVETGTTTASIPNAVMALSYVAQVEQTSADAELSVDWVRIAQVSGRA